MISILLWCGALVLLAIVAGYLIGLAWGFLCIVWYVLYYLWRSLCDTM